MTKADGDNVTAKGLPSFAELLVQADAQYRSIPSLSGWGHLSVPETTWDSLRERVSRLAAESPEKHRRALEVVRRAAAIDTGAIEGLYQTNWGFTLTVAAGAAGVEAAFEGPHESPHSMRALIEAQITAYDDVLDFATRRAPITEAWIRQLHADICAPQETYKVWTPSGWQEHELPKGQYKLQPNHVIQPDNTLHSYAPVEATAPEMERLCFFLRSEEFDRAHPIVQAAYAHHAFVTIHPFSDGNGRVARALASAFTFRALSTPLLILVDNKDEYLRALRAADAGNYQEFTNFILYRVIDGVRLAEQSMQTASEPVPDEVIAHIQRLYVTKGGYRHEDVDAVGNQFLELFAEELRERASRCSGGISAHVEFLNGPHDVSVKSHRVITSPRRLRLNLQTAAPANANVDLVYGLEVPRDCDVDDEFRIVLIGHDRIITAGMRDLHPSPSAVSRMNLRMAAQQFFARALSDVLATAAAQVNRVYPRP